MKMKRLTFAQRALKSGLLWDRGRRGPASQRYAPRPLLAFEIPPLDVCMSITPIVPNRNWQSRAWKERIQ